MNDSSGSNLGEGLQKLIQQVSSRLVRAQDIATIPANDPRRRTYRLWFEDGRQLKGRYYPSSRFALVARRIREMNALEFLPAIVNHHADAMLEEWIAGESLAMETTNQALIQQCGRMQGLLHRALVPSLDDFDFKPLQISDWAAMMSKSLASLVHERVLPQAEAHRLEHLALQHAPTRQQLGVVNRDVCPENLVVNAQGRLFLVDNGSLTVGSVEEDLCRTWYRWPMLVDERQAFSAGYREFGDPAGLTNPSIFWRVVVVANSARFRLANSREAAIAALARLDEPSTIREA
jgi:hypothetical protein